MSLLITITGVWLGYAYAGLVHRRFGPTDRHRWSLLAPVWAVYAVVLLTADTGEPVPRAVQAFAMATVLFTVVDAAGLWWRRRTHRRVMDERITYG
ncbi:MULTISPECIES: hypothetical protein [unclassified Modestobacter]|uniref:hypothetical protein n=1 Tax=unclassified Modestobacter TaxID=2643866 RepID=UPI0022AA80CD|nr:MULTISPECIES: hypothetical protein [unclassified Modestobacter]MCZ2823542.1 hypothetical protein [Modestobacter sp. VKM Ac-2981]MCZ2851787.1 hypothetical protein [Modestobacter sp. VKM Ac-2982]